MPEQDELISRVTALEAEVSFLKVIVTELLRTRSTPQVLEPRSATQYVLPNQELQKSTVPPPKPIAVNKSWHNLRERCRSSEKRGKVDEIAYEAIHGVPDLPITDVG